jgi:tetratricopeptide (TPR) repeat protein
MRNQVKREPTRSAEAYDSYLRGKYELLGQLIQPGVGSNAIPTLERAVALDDQFALAYAALSRACVSKYFYSKPEQTHDLELKAAKSFERALDLAPNLAEAHFAKGYFFWTPSQHWQVETAIKEERVALDLSPQSQEISDHLTLIYLHLGLFQNAGLLAAHAARSNPLHPLTHFLEANALFWQGQDADAVQIWQSIPNAWGANFVMHSYQAVALMNLGRTNEAANLIADALRKDPSDPGGLFKSVQAILLARQGDKAGASQKIAAASRQRNGFGLFPHALYNIAAAFALLDEPENAMKFLREAAADGFPCYPFFKVDVNLNHLRSRDDFNKFLAEQQKLHEVFEAKYKERSSTGG